MVVDGPSRSIVKESVESAITNTELPFRTLSMETGLLARIKRESLSSLTNLSKNQMPKLRAKPSTIVGMAHTALALGGFMDTHLGVSCNKVIAAKSQIRRIKEATSFSVRLRLSA